MKLDNQKICKCARSDRWHRRRVALTHSYRAKLKSGHHCGLERIEMKYFDIDSNSALHEFLKKWSRKYSTENSCGLFPA